MNFCEKYSIDLPEIKYLKNIVPEELRSQLEIVESPSDDSVLIETRQTSPRQFCIQLNLDQWNILDRDQRNLIFWHEIVRTQARRIHQISPGKIIISMGSLAFLLELGSQNLLGLSITLSVMTLAIFHLYQRSWGESGIKAITSADKSAIQLATEFGYSVPAAVESLSGALQVLCRHNTQKSLRRMYQIRLRVLEILHHQEYFALQPEFVPIAIPVHSLVIPILES